MKPIFVFLGAPIIGEIELLKPLQKYLRYP